MRLEAYSGDDLGYAPLPVYNGVGCAESVIHKWAPFGLRSLLQKLVPGTPGCSYNWLMLECWGWNDAISFLAFCLKYCYDDQNLLAGFLATMRRNKLR